MCIQFSVVWPLYFVQSDAVCCILTKISDIHGLFLQIWTFVECTHAASNHYITQCWVVHQSWCHTAWCHTVVEHFELLTSCFTQEAILREVIRCYPSQKKKKRTIMVMYHVISKNMQSDFATIIDAWSHGSRNSRSLAVPQLNQAPWFLDITRFWFYASAAWFFFCPG